VLAVEQHLAAAFLGQRNAVANARQVVIQVLATKQIESAALSRSAASPGSLAAERPARRVMPKAVKRALAVGFLRKNSVSRGLAPG
jgi:hypothetical protein